MRKLPLILALVALIAFPQYASAQANSGIDQYEENAPTAGGDRPTGDRPTGDRPTGDRPTGGGQTGAGGGGDGSDTGTAGTGSSGSGSSTASGSGSGDLKAGAGGTRSEAAGSRHGDGSREGTPEDVTSVAAEQGSSRLPPLSAGEDSPDEGGIGIVLPIILGASLVAALAFMVARQVRRRDASPA